MFQTMKDIHVLLNANLNSSNEELVKHAKTLCSPRTHGSMTKYGLGLVPGSRLINDSTESFQSVLSGDVKLYSVNAPEILGSINAMALTDIRVIENIRVRKGLHGLELHIPEPSIVDQPCKLQKCETIYFIVGNFQGEEALFTWHPGPPLAVLNPLTAVKW